MPVPGLGPWDRHDWDRTSSSGKGVDGVAPSREEFAWSVMRRLQNLERGDVVKSADLSHAAELRASAAETAPLGHPSFVNLPLGGAGRTEGVAMFLDLRRFTARSFWDAPDQVMTVNVAVISELAAAVKRHGGYVLGFRGDGVFACFDGGGLDSRAVAGVAVGAAAWALDAVQNALNSLLQQSGIEPVQVRAGLDYGRLDFVRIGSTSGSEVNVLGFAANFASKCEKAALAWEIVVGQGLAALLPPGDLTQHEDSPAQYQRGGHRRTYSYYQVAPAAYLRHIRGVADELAGSSVSAIRVR